MTDAEADVLAEEAYNRRMAQFDLHVALTPRPKKRRAFGDYTTKNCEESWGGR